MEILKTQIGEVTADHRLAQPDDAKSGKIDLPNKLGALRGYSSSATRCSSVCQLTHGHRARAIDNTNDSVYESVLAFIAL